MSIDGIKHFLFWELKQIWLLSPATSTFVPGGLSPLPQAQPTLLTPTSSLKIIWIAPSRLSYSWNNLLLHWCCELHRFSCSLYSMKITKARMQLFLRTPMITLKALSQPFHDFLFPILMKKRAETGAHTIFMTALMLPGHTKMDLFRAAHEELTPPYKHKFYTQFLFTMDKRKLIKQKKRFLNKMNLLICSLPNKNNLKI